GVMEKKDRVARRETDHRHVAADRLVDAVVRVELELGLGAEPALPRRRRAVLTAWPRRAERFEVRAVHDPRDHRLADHVLRAAHRGEVGIVGGHAADRTPPDAGALRERRTTAE